MIPYMVEIEYLESTGTQRIDTGIDDYKKSVTATFMTDGQHNVFGNPIFGNDSYSWYHVTLFNNRFFYSGGKTSQERSSGTVVYNKKTTIEYNTKDYVLKIDGTITDNKVIVDSRSNTNIFIGWRSRNNLYSFMKYYSFSIVNKEDNTLLRDFIPVRIGTTGYMYDKVSGQLFGNAGTGNFILGPDVAPVTYANEVAFLESWGNQYIDTGIKPSTDTKIELKCLYCKSGAGLTSYGSLIGADDRSNAYILNHSAVANFTYGLEFSNNFANPQTRLLTFNSTASPQNMRVYDEGGSLVTTLTCLRGVFEVNQNLYLFAVNRNGTPVYGSNRIMYCKIYDGDTLVRDYVPVEYNGVGYMYDKVSGLFFNNQGTGKFLFGSIAKACARSYTRRQLMSFKLPYDAEIEYLQSADSSSQWIDTGIQADSSTTSVYLDISFSGSYRNSNGGSIFTGDDSSNSFSCNFGGNAQPKSIYAWFSKPYASGGQIRKIDNVTLTRGIMSYNNGVFSYGGKSVTTQVVAGKRNANLHILENFKAYSIARLYGGEIKENGVTIMDLIPVRVGTVGYLYDRISKNLLANGGTDPFIAGPDK